MRIGKKVRFKKSSISPWVAGVVVLEIDESTFGISDDNGDTYKVDIEMIMKPDPKREARRVLKEKGFEFKRSGLFAPPDYDGSLSAYTSIFKLPVTKRLFI